MGASNSTENTPQYQEFKSLSLKNFSLSSFVEKLSGRTFASNSIRSNYSVSRPWSRVSRKGWRESTLSDPFECIKTAWPVSLIEALFLPDFKISFDKELEYETLYLISKGAYGKVYKVIKKDSQEIYALKILKKSQIIQENCINQVKDEVKIQSMCGHHPFIADSPKYWQNRRQLFIVNTFLEGGDLLSLIDKYGSLPEKLCQIYIAELASAIDFLHNAGVIYRDLKPENVLLDSDYHCVLIDFGLSKWLKYGSKTKTICGTLQYIAPEVFSLEGYGHAVDWWSLGVLTTYILSSKCIECKCPEGSILGHQTAFFKVIHSTVIVPLHINSALMRHISRSRKYPDCGNTTTPGKVEGVELSVAARDLVGRLLQPEPNKRLRSLLTLKTIPFFMGFNFEHARAKKTSPKEILAASFPDGPKLEMKESQVVFLNFDQITPTLV